MVKTEEQTKSEKREELRRRYLKEEGLELDGAGAFDKPGLSNTRVEHIVGKEVVAFAEEKMIGTTAAAAPPMPNIRRRR